MNEQDLNNGWIDRTYTHDEIKNNKELDRAIKDRDVEYLKLPKNVKHIMVFVDHKEKLYHVKYRKVEINEENA